MIKTTEEKNSVGKIQASPTINRDDLVYKLLLVLVDHKKRILTFTLVITLVAAAISLFLMSKWYDATAVVLPPEKSSALDALSGNLGIGAAFLNLGSGGSNGRYMAILGSTRLRKAVIDQFDLLTEYESETLDEALESLDKNLIVRQDKKLGTIYVTITYREDPVKAAEMANFVVHQLDLINRELATEQARSSRLFIERRYEQAQADLATTEDTLRLFQKQHGVVSISEQTKAGIEASAHIQGQIVALEVEYNVKKKTLGGDHPDLQRLKSEISELKREQKNMEYGGTKESIFIPFRKVPDLGLQYLRLYRDVEINGKIIEFLVPQYEQAKLQEAKDTPTLLVLDKARPADKPIKPKKRIITFLSAMLAFIASLMYYFAMGEIRSIGANDAHPKYAKWQAFLRLWDWKK